MNLKNAIGQKMLLVKEMEEEIKELHEKCTLMDTEKNLSGNLLDSEGFPRSDLNYGDLEEYRNLKKRYNELNNDHKKLMLEIEHGLFGLHSSFLHDPEVLQDAEKYAEVTKHMMAAQQIAAQQQPQPQQKQPVKQNEGFKIQQKAFEFLTPFAKIGSVEADSPAFKAGLLPGDLISQIGDITIYEPDNVKSIPRVVKEDVPVKMVVMRLGGNVSEGTKLFNVRGEMRAKVEVTVTPKRWDGKGLLGCKIDPLY